MGQFIQEGDRVMFETVVHVEKATRSVVIGSDPQNLDQLNYLAGKPVEHCNHMAELGTVIAHQDGGVTYSDIASAQLQQSNSGWAYNLMLGGQQTLPWDIRLSANAIMMGSQVTLQGRTTGMSMAMVGLTKSFLNDRLSFSTARRRRPSASSPSPTPRRAPSRPFPPRKATRPSSSRITWAAAFPSSPPWASCPSWWPDSTCAPSSPAPSRPRRPSP